MSLLDTPTSSTRDYQSFLASKSQVGGMSGFEPIWMPDFLFDFQKSLVEWAIRKGRAAIFADCGLGKTPMQLVWAENCVRKTNRPSLMLTPLAVSTQMQREAVKFGIETHVARDGKPKPNITITNYEQLKHFDPDDFGSVGCDESSILKNCDGTTRQLVTDFMRKIQYRLLCTATAAPNDHVELGTSSEALGYLGHQDMVTRFFKEDTVKDYLGWGRKAYRFRGHSEQQFWKWVCSWARICRKPSDLGFSDERFILPKLFEQEHRIADAPPRDGFLFSVPAGDIREQREERRITINERCEVAANYCLKHDSHSLVWCHLNDEGDLLEKLMPGSIQISGSDSDEWKSAAVEWFVGDICRCQLMNKRRSIKLATCQNDQKDTGKNGTTLIGRNESPSPLTGPLGTEKSERHISQPIIEPTSQNSNSRQNKRSRKTKSGVGDMETIPSSANCIKYPSANGVEQTHQRFSPKDSEGTNSLSKATGDCIVSNAENVLSADQSKKAEKNPRQDSTSIIAIPPESSGDCSARTAITVSENSAIIRPSCSGPCPICGNHREQRRVLISKPKILSFGLNFQHCHNVVTFPSHSFEQYYQSIRRCYRFGQKHPVTVTIVTTEGESDVLKNLKRKAAQADRMFSELTRNANEALTIQRDIDMPEKEVIPSWL